MKTIRQVGLPKVDPVDEWLVYPEKIFAKYVNGPRKVLWDKCHLGQTNGEISEEFSIFTSQMDLTWVLEKTSVI